MQVHKVTLIVFDFDEIGAESVKEVLETTKYPNHCINSFVQHIISKDIDEWVNDFFNKHKTFDQSITDLFK